MKYVFVNGYGCTGSSAVVDFLREFDNIEVPAAEKEFRIIKDPYGIIDLDRALNNSIDPLNEDIAIKKFIWMTKKYIAQPGHFTDVRCGYINDFGENIKVQTQKYIQALISMRYEGYWWYMDMEKSAFSMFYKKLLKKLKIKDFETYEDMFLYLLSEDEFVIETKKYLENLFTPFVFNKDSYVVLDNAIPAVHPSYAERYFGDFRMINVERDPRDVYVNLLKKKLLTGYHSAKFHNPVIFVEWFKKQRQKQEHSNKVMTVWFEDFVAQYEEYRDKICSFLSLSLNQNNNQKEYFDPDRSIKDVGLWKKYQNKKEIDYIEENLKSYLYDEKS